MTIQEELSRSSPSKGTILTIGTFDGVHLGHQHLLRILREKAAASGNLSLALTFRNHPRTVLQPGSEMQYVSPLRERIDLLKAQGVDMVVEVDFTRELSLLRAQEFVALLVEHLKMRGMVVGPDFALGHRREGDIPTLQRLGKEMGVRVDTVQPLHGDEGVIRSSAIRDTTARGDVERVAFLLGRGFSLTGTVVEGDRRGKALGFPTANLQPGPQIIVPGDGIYATWAIVEGRSYPSTTSIGVRPTFAPSQRTVETFIMEFDGDLYGKPLTIEFVTRLREERAFPDAEALIEQMKVDVERSRSVLSPQEVAKTSTGI